jgi:excisionase family DNA binding protein
MSSAAKELRLRSRLERLQAEMTDIFAELGELAAAVSAPPPDAERQYTAPEAAAKIGCSEWSVYNLCANGRLEHARVGRIIRISGQQIADYLTRATEASAR